MKKMVDNSRIMSTIFDTEIEELYLINGLSRSGNHLFISWLISSFLPGETYFLNNISNIRRIENPKELDLKLLTISCIASSNNPSDQGSKFDENIRKNLVSYQETVDLLLGKKKKINKLILSIENNFTDMLDFYQQRFKRARKVYKIIIIRDILNLLASRFEAERELVKEIKKNRPEFAWHTYETDIVTVGYWVNNVLEPYIKKNQYIIFNYNKFILHETFRKNLALQLNIVYERTKIKNTGFLKGTSFKNKNQKDIFKYFFRWLKYLDDKLMRFLLEDKTILQWLCKYFDLCIESKNQTIKIGDTSFSIKEMIEKYIKKKEKNEKKMIKKQKNTKILSKKKLKILK